MVGCSFSSLQWVSTLVGPASAILSLQPEQNRPSLSSLGPCGSWAYLQPPQLDSVAFVVPVATGSGRWQPLPQLSTTVPRSWFLAVMVCVALPGVGRAQRHIWAPRGGHSRSFFPRRIFQTPQNGSCLKCVQQEAPGSAAAAAADLPGEPGLPAQQCLTGGQALWLSF